MDNYITKSYKSRQINIMNTSDFKQARRLKENLAQVLYSLQHLKVDGVSLKDNLKINGQIKLSKEGDIQKEDVTNLRTALALSEGLLTMTQNIETPRNSGVAGAIYQANQRKRNK